MGSAEDYKVLGLEEGTDRETVERKYGAMLRAYKSRTDEYGATDEDMEYYKKITQAYDNIVGTVHDFSDPNPTSPLPFKFRNFFYKLSARLDHYKFIIFAVLITGVLGLIIFFQVKDATKDDMYIKFVGAYYAINPGVVEKELAEKSDQFDSPRVSFFSVTVNSSENDSETANGAVAFRAQFTAGSIDMIFIDKDNFDVYLDQYVFMQLDDFIESNSDDPAFADLEYYRYKGEKIPEGIYGIEFTEAGARYFSDTSMMWLNDEIEGQERSMILCVCRMSRKKNIERALKYIKELVDEAYLVS
ncbi:MAG: hypothetical protein J5950_02420 [Clostridia bacterium]|nr:hypothetical protein [Clostridia bacterium]